MRRWHKHGQRTNKRDLKASHGGPYGGGDFSAGPSSIVGGTIRRRHKPGVEENKLDLKASWGGPCGGGDISAGS